MARFKFRVNEEGNGFYVPGIQNPGAVVSPLDSL